MDHSEQPNQPPYVEAPVVQATERKTDIPETKCAGVHLMLSTPDFDDKLQDCFAYYNEADIVAMPAAEPYNE